MRTNDGVPGDDVEPTHGTDHPPGARNLVRILTETLHAHDTALASGADLATSLTPRRWSGQASERFVADGVARVDAAWQGVTEVNRQVLDEVSRHGTFLHALRELWRTYAHDPPQRARLAALHAESSQKLAAAMLARAAQLDTLGHVEFAEPTPLAHPDWPTPHHPAAPVRPAPDISALLGHPPPRTADATPTDAIPTDANPADATPADATPTDATPAEATPTEATAADATAADATASTADADDPAGDSGDSDEAGGDSEKAGGDSEKAGGDTGNTGNTAGEPPPPAGAEPQRQVQPVFRLPFRAPDRLREQMVTGERRDHLSWIP